MRSAAQLLRELPERSPSRNAGQIGAGQCPLAAHIRCGKAVKTLGCVARLGTLDRLRDGYMTLCTNMPQRCGFTSCGQEFDHCSSQHLPQNPLSPLPCPEPVLFQSICLSPITFPSRTDYLPLSHQLPCPPLAVLPMTLTPPIFPALIQVLKGSPLFPGTYFAASGALCDCE